MAAEGSGGSEFAQLQTDHIGLGHLGDLSRDFLFNGGSSGDRSAGSAIGRVVNDLSVDMIERSVDVESRLFRRSCCFLIKSRAIISISYVLIPI